jgi:multidrug efflux pump subunit AcrA (membrane-fusion protein)
MATYRFPCPQCGQELAVKEDVAAERSTVGCPFCRATIPIPQEAAEDAKARRAEALAKAEGREHRREAREAQRAEREERRRREAEQREREAEERRREEERQRRDKEIEAALRVPEETAPAAEAPAQEPPAVSEPAQEPERILDEAHPAMFRNRPVWFILCLLLCPVGIGLIILLIWWLGCLGKKLTITQSRVMLRSGVLSKYTTEVNLADVRSVQVNQSFGQRIFGVGSLGIASAGTAGTEILIHGIPRPQRFAELIRSGRR